MLWLTLSPIPAFVNVMSLALLARVWYVFFKFFSSNLSSTDFRILGAIIVCFSGSRDAQSVDNYAANLTR